MDVGTVQFGQSHSINRYIAKKNNWMGKTDEDAAVGKPAQHILFDGHDGSKNVDTRDSHNTQETGSPLC
jgi:hypothetical protein